jgi:small subunit ribosomal protein S1
VLSVGDEVEARITNVDRKNRVITLSVRAKDQAQDKEALDTQGPDANAPKTIGDLIKKQMENSNES